MYLVVREDLKMSAGKVASVSVNTSANWASLRKFPSDQLGQFEGTEGMVKGISIQYGAATITMVS